MRQLTRFANTIVPNVSITMNTAKLIIEIEQEDDGRWIAELPNLPGVLAYGQTRDEAVLNAQILAFRVIADRLEHGEMIPQVQSVFTVAS
jgi:predicted RNase H-like HicB family nuclease